MWLKIWSPQSPLKIMYKRKTIRKKTFHFPHQDTLPWKDHLQSLDQSCANEPKDLQKHTQSCIFCIIFNGPDATFTPSKSLRVRPNAISFNSPSWDSLFRGIAKNWCAIGLWLSHFSSLRFTWPDKFASGITESVEIDIENVIDQTTNLL